MSIYVILHVYTTVQCDHYVHMYTYAYVRTLSECRNEHVNVHTYVQSPEKVHMYVHVYIRNPVCAHNCTVT
jgi:hypothetical protein